MNSEDIDSGDVDLEALERQCVELLVEALSEALPAFCQKYSDQCLYAVCLLQGSELDGFGLIGNTVEVVEESVRKMPHYPRAMMQTHAGSWGAFGDYEPFVEVNKKMYEFNDLGVDDGALLDRVILGAAKKVDFPHLVITQYKGDILTGAFDPSPTELELRRTLAVSAVVNTPAWHQQVKDYVEYILAQEFVWRSKVPTII